MIASPLRFESIGATAPVVSSQRSKQRKSMHLNSAYNLRKNRVFTDEQLDRAAPVSLNADAPLTTQFFIEDHALRHSWRHLAKIKERPSETSDAAIRNAPTHVTNADCFQPQFAHLREWVQFAQDESTAPVVSERHQVRAEGASYRSLGRSPRKPNHPP